MSKGVLFLIGFILVLAVDSSAQQIVWTTVLDSCQTASSPRLTDLNGDDVLDVVIGDGIFNDVDDLGHINALDGVDGSEIWRKDVGFDKFNSALFYDFNNDETDDIVISGRFPELLAIDGTDGSTIWEFDNQTIEPPTGWKHFYNQQLLPDLNNDQIPEILASNGGEQDSLPGSISRPPGFLVIIDGSDGTLVSYAQVPDSAEVYCAPVVYDMDNDTQLEIVFGTGGETHPGSLWLAELSDLLAGNIDNAINLAQNQSKGFLGSPALADINNDGRMDIIGSSFEGYLTVINGVNLTELWRFNLPGSETYITPAIGYFNNDEYLDLFMGFGVGSFPFYEKHRQFLLDGTNGDVLYQDSLGYIGMSSPVAIDIDNDAHDEVYYMINVPNPNNPNDFSSGTSFLRFYDFNDATFSNLSPENAGLSWGTTPHIKDVDNDGEVEIFYGFSVDDGLEIENKSVEIVRMNLSGDPDLEAPWAAYQGSAYTSIYGENLTTEIPHTQAMADDCTRRAFANGSINMELLYNCEDANLLNVEIYDLLGRTLLTYYGNEWHSGLNQLSSLLADQAVLAKFQIGKDEFETRLILFGLN